MHWPDRIPERLPIQGPPPIRVEYPYGLPGDGFRRLAREGNATCVAIHDGVDPRVLVNIRPGNAYRYGAGDPQYDSMVEDMRSNGYDGGDGGRIIVHVSPDDMWVAEGNHRLKAALHAEIDRIDLEIRYLNGADEAFHLIPFSIEELGNKVVHE